MSLPMRRRDLALFMMDVGLYVGELFGGLE